MTRFHRAGAGLFAVISLSACVPDKAEVMPLDAAMVQTPRHLTQDRVRTQSEVAMHFPLQPIQVGTRYWQVSPTRLRIPAEQLQPVAMAGGMTFHSLRGERMPYTHLYVASPVHAGHYQQFRHVYGFTAEAPEGAVGPVHFGATHGDSHAPTGADDHGAH